MFAHRLSRTCNLASFLSPQVVCFANCLENGNNDDEGSEGCLLAFLIKLLFLSKKNPNALQLNLLCFMLQASSSSQQQQR
jgi:hypothetical protein